MSNEEVAINMVRILIPSGFNLTSSKHDEGINFVTNTYFEVLEILNNRIITQQPAPQPQDKK